MTKQEILDNPAALSADQLAEAVRGGTVTLFELVRTGKLDMAARQALKEALDRPAQAPEPQPEPVSKPAEKPAMEPVDKPVDKPADKPASTRIYQHDPSASDKKAPWKNPTGTPKDIKPKKAIATKTVTPPVPVEPEKPGVYIPPKPPRKNRPMFRHFFTAHGRITRCEYLWTYIIMVIYYVAMAMWATQMPRYEVYAAICFFCYIYFIIVAGIKRCHDLGHCGWWQLIPLYFLWMFFKRGSYETNRYGLTPNKKQS